MSATLSEYLDVISRIPRGGVLLLNHVSWQEYEQVLAELGNHPRFRVSYDCGRMEVVAPLPIHEIQKGLVHDFVVIMVEEVGQEVEALGSTTLKRELRTRGAEPDDCFYIRNATLMRGKQAIDLGLDPAPDLVLEIDATSESVGKFPIYAGLGVPEIWRYDGRQLHLHVLDGDEYREVRESAAFPQLTSEILSKFIEMGMSHGQSAARKVFREWARQQSHRQG